ncbi:MAG: type VI secretion system baseplate subunit TssK [Algicola sp.]|nr:type VI secretion system baseplate subunit TssK [Algicola sp.]
MSSKVIWYEGTFIQPQHFQQQETFLLQQLDNRVRQQFPFCYGFSKLKIDHTRSTQFSLSFCHGVFQDGTSFVSPEPDELPLSIEVSHNTKDAIVYLAIPLKKKGMPDVGSKDEPGSLVRYLPDNKEIVDLTSEQGKTADLKLGELRIRLFVEELNVTQDSQRVPDGYIKLAVAHIIEVRSGQIKLNEEFIPTISCFDTSTILAKFISELHGMIYTRANELAGRIASVDGKDGVAGTMDFMLLQMLNRFEPLFAHYKNLVGLHPLFMYQQLISFCGELSTFMTQSKRPIPFPDYNHDDPIRCFGPIINEIHQSFSVVQEQLARAIPLSPPKNGIRAARITDPNILDSASFVLAVAAQVSPEKLRSQFPAQIKIGPGEKIYRLVHSQLPGIQIVPMPTAPREIPYNAGFTYFELNKQNPLWQELKVSKGMAFHVSGDFPGLEMQFWSINRR